MNAMDCGVGGAASVGFDSASGGGASKVMGAGECSAGVGGAGAGVGMRGAGGVCEWTMGGVCAMGRLAGGTVCR